MCGGIDVGVLIPQICGRMASPSSPIDALCFRNRFVETLPGDPVSQNRTRNVLGACYSRVDPTPVAAPELLAVVPEVAELLDLSPATTPQLTDVLSGNQVLPGMQPYAACYGGHQFGSWAGQLGDGRAITLTEIENAQGQSFELQLKGAGRTPYSRRGDGRAVLRSSLRELVCSEAMHHLGVPTTRALSLALAGESVVRDMLYDGHPAEEPAAIVARVAPSFLRFGNFEIHAARKDYDTLTRLVQFSATRYFPQFVREGEGKVDITGLFQEVCERTARLMVEWTRVGFVHGVMNTDNMSLLGLTIDYGPYGWMDVFDPHWTPNTTDAGGRRYRFGQQPAVAQWNLAQLAGALATLVSDVAPLEKSLVAYADHYAELEQRMWLQKLGLRPGLGEDAVLLRDLFAALVAIETDMTLFFRCLADAQAADYATLSSDERLQRMAESIYDVEAAPAEQVQVLSRWLDAYAERLRADDSEGGVDNANADANERRERMHAVNPLYVPRNYLVQQVIDKTEAGDRQALQELLAVLRQPYRQQPGREAYTGKRPEWARHKPGCSMLSCSS